MKTFNEFLQESKLENISTVDVQLMDEEATTSATTTGGVANPDAKPIFKKGTFIGHQYIEVDDETYANFMTGKVPFSRWNKNVSDPDLRDQLKDLYHKRRKLLIKNQKTGGMVFVK